MAVGHVFEAEAREFGERFEEGAIGRGEVDFAEFEARERSQVFERSRVDFIGWLIAFDGKVFELGELGDGVEGREVDGAIDVEARRIGVVGAGFGERGGVGIAHSEGAVTIFDGHLWRGEGGQDEGREKCRGECQGFELFHLSFPYLRFS